RLARSRWRKLPGLVPWYSGPGIRRCPAGLPILPNFGIFKGERRAMRAPLKESAVRKWGSRCPTFFICCAAERGLVADQDLREEIEAGLGELGFELVELERGGTSRRPVLRLRIDRLSGGEEDVGVSLDDCARVSRALEARLEASERVPATYVLE